jgi:hypothetical protein
VPVQVARFMADVAIHERSRSRDELTIVDYQCGSGTLLAEAIHSLQRSEFCRHLTLIGRDTNEVALLLAKVAMTIALSGTSFTATVDIAQPTSGRVSDWPAADILFIHQPHDSPASKSTRLGARMIRQGVESLRPGGILAAIVPVGLLAAKCLAPWRRNIVAVTDPIIVMQLGTDRGRDRSYGLVVLRAKEQGLAPSRDTVIVGWAADEVEAVSELIRAVRRVTHSDSVPMPTHADDKWALATIPLCHWRRRPTWLPQRARFGPVALKLSTGTQFQLGDLFSIRSGPHLDGGAALLISQRSWERLPINERQYFRPALDSSCIANGQIREPKWLFMPLLEWASAQDVEREMPSYYWHFLWVTRGTLSERPAVMDNRWWEYLPPKVEPEHGPRLVSQRTGLVPSVALESGSSLAIVEANFWRPRDTLLVGSSTSALDLMRIYWWILNSRVMQALLKEFCPMVAAGYLDCDPKLLKRVPIPHVANRLSQEPSMRALLLDIAQQYGDQLPPMMVRDQLTEALFSVPHAG